MESYVGKVQGFKLNGRMTPFKVIRQVGGLLFLQSLDLKFEAKVFSDSWDRQAEILKAAPPDASSPPPPGDGQPPERP